jgi:pimeloyl-ACP methyl ester carboxylesterase
MRLAARGYTFDVRVAGPPQPAATVLLLHGFPQHGGLWDAVTPALHAQGLRTIARPTDVAAYSVPQCAADALSIVDSLGIAGPVHLVGHDWGAMVGWQLVAEHPERVRSFIALSVPHPNALRHALYTTSDQRTRSGYVKLFRETGKAEHVLLAGDAAALRGLFAGSGLSRAEADRYVAPLLQPGALTGALNWYRAIPAWGFGGLAPARVPTTFVWSDGDVAIGRTAAQRCARYVEADYRFVPLSGVSHWIPDQAPRTVIDEVLRRVARQ